MRQMQECIPGRSIHRCETPLGCSAAERTLAAQNDALSLGAVYAFPVKLVFF